MNLWCVADGCLSFRERIFDESIVQRLEYQ